MGSYFEIQGEATGVRFRKDRGRDDLPMCQLDISEGQKVINSGLVKGQTRR